MPKLNATHLPERLQEAIEQLERGEEVEAKKNKTLLNAEQQKALDDAWAIQQQLRKQHKPPKTEVEKQRIGWKDKREVRIEIYKQALNDLNTNAVDDYEELQRQREVKAARVFMEAFSQAKEQDKNAWSAGNKALRTGHFNRVDGQNFGYRNKRDREVNEMEENLRKRYEAQMTDEEREQQELLNEHEKAIQKHKKV